MKTNELTDLHIKCMEVLGEIGVLEHDLKGVIKQKEFELSKPNLERRIAIKWFLLEIEYKNQKIKELKQVHKNLITKLYENQ